jgi:DNA-binding NarL/FixJ family response regulator
MSQVRILIADDHEVVRRGLRVLIEARLGWEICGEAGTGREAVEKSTELRPDVVVLDIGMPELNGLEATRQIVKAVPGTQVLILTIHESEQLVREVLAAGARGYVLKSDAGRDLLRAIDALRTHRAFLTSKVAEIVARDYRRRAVHGENIASAGSPLSAREREIVELLARGRSNKEVALALDISVKTAETHRSHIMAKLNLHSIGDLVRYAVRNGIIEA